MTCPASPARRRFLQTLTTTVAAVGVGPTLLGMSDKAGRRRPIVGSGAYTYEVHHDWGELPSTLKYGHTHG
ncbi:MAG TPA: twin-arginine translocation signal domain-containing protein, partial [Vicinamibacterales bacterium]